MSLQTAPTKHHASNDAALQPLLHQAVAAPNNSAKPPFPPTLKRLMETADLPPKGRDEQMLAGYANLTVARYFLHHASVPQARQLSVWVYDV